MKFLIKTQVIAIVFSVLWIVYLNIMAFFDQPNRAMQNINMFVYGFAVMIGVIYLILTKSFLEKRWIAIPIVLFTDLFLYQPLFLKILSTILSKEYEAVVIFFSIATGSVNLLTTTLGLFIGIILTRPKNNLPKQ